MPERRRSVLAFGLALGAGLEVARAQASLPLPLIGYLSARSQADAVPQLAAFRQGLADNGLVEGRHFSIEFRWADGQYERLPQLAADLVERRAAVIFTAGGSPPALAVKAATSTIPIVFNSGGDLVRLGLVKSFSRPEGNVTGISQFTTVLGPKRLELLREVAPGIRRVALLGNGSNANFPNEEAQVRAAAGALGLGLWAFRASTLGELQAAFEAMTRQRVDALTVAADAFIDNNRRLITAFAARQRIAAAYPWPEYVTEGGLMSYGIDLPDSYRKAGVYVARILKGATPADLPVVQPTEFRLVINQSAARAMNLRIPQSVVLRADEVRD